MRKITRNAEHAEIYPSSACSANRKPASDAALSATAAPIHAAIACAVIYAPLCIYVLAFGGLIERVFVGGLGDFGEPLQIEAAKGITSFGV